MRAYIRPDSFLIWEGPDGQIMTGTSKHQVTFTNGLSMEATNGSGLLVPSRVSTLTISNPEPLDAGTYTCSVMGTDQAVTIELVVNETATTSTASKFNNSKLIVCRDLASIVREFRFTTPLSHCLNYLYLHVFL